jgi:hypothetical protein
VLVVGCGGDDNSVSPPSPDGGESDVTVGPDGTTTPDGPVVTTPEAGPDVLDSGSSPGTGDADAQPATEAGAPPTLFDFPHVQATALCNRYKTCCMLDAGVFNFTQCVADNLGYGFNSTFSSDPSVVDGGHVVYDSTSAASCVQGIQNLTCTGNTKAAYGALTKTCFAVLHGTLPIGQGPCRSSWECASGAYCAATTDGGTACAALVGPGGSCSSSTNDLSDTACSYLGTGTPAYYCNLINPGDAGPTCQPLLADGTSCASSDLSYSDPLACQSSTCGDNFKCGSSVTLVNGTFCSYYQVLDAGAQDAGDGG